MKQETMTANEIIGSTLSDELFRRNMTPNSLALSIGISQCEIENVCNGISAGTTVVKIIRLFDKT